MLGSDHPNAIPQKRIRRYKGDHFDYLLTNRPDEWRDQLIAEFPHDRKGIERFFKAAKKLGKSFKNYSTVFRSEETMNFYERMLNKRRLLKFVIPFIPFITYSGEKGLKKGLKRFFKDDAIHRIFSAEVELLACLVPIGWAYYGDFQSPPKGGGQVIPEWLAHVVQYFKNDILTQCKVNQVLLRDKAVTGISFEHRGHEYQVKCKYVVAACDVETLYEKMLPPRSSRRR